MRCMDINKQEMFISLYSSKQKVMSGQTWTGEWTVKRSTPFRVYAPISPAKGNAYLDTFGPSADYDRIITLEYVGSGITTTSVVWVDRMPQFDASGNLVVDTNGDPSIPYDYVVTCVAESINSTQIAIKRVHAQ